MSRLAICLLGPPAIVLDGQPVMLDRWKAVALLAYLAVEDGPHRRDGLATLLWPELSQAQARNGLRRTLNALHHALGDQWLDASRETIQLPRISALSIDVWQFRALIGAHRGAAAPADALREAVALYRGDFLAEFSLRDAPAFDDWRYFAAEQLRQEWTGAIDALLRAQTAAGDLQAAVQTARRWLALDPLEEEAHRTLIKLHLAAGDRAAAVRQYEHCVQWMGQELGVEPDTATRALLAAPPQRSTPPVPAIPNVAGPPAARQQAGDGNGETLPGSTEAMRQVVVLNAGIIGWPAGAGRRSQQELVQQFLASAAAVLQRYAAHVDSLGPEGIVALFGVPRSHEDDSARALHVAFGLQAAAHDSGIDLAAGIKIGPVLVTWSEGGDGALHVFGAVLSQAAELQRAAAAGQILADRVTYLHTHSACTFQPIPVRLRGQPAAVEAYWAVAELPLRKTRGIPELQARFVGRAAELGLLAKAIADLEAGAGQVLLISGEAGIGKSRLVAEARARCTPGSLWLEGRCLEMTETASFTPFLNMLRDCFGWPLDAGEEEVAAAIRNGLARFAAAAGWDEEACAEIGAALGRLFAVRFASPWDSLLANAAPAELRHRTLAALRTLLEAASRTHPLILVLEDLHWADDASLDLIGDLLPAVARNSLLLICVYRPIPEQRCSQLPLLAARKCPEHYQELHLRELTPGQVSEMVASLLAVDELAPATRSWILDRAQGNPYFTEEIILSLIEGGLIRHESDAWRSRGSGAGAPGDLALPFSVDQLVAARVDQLPRPLRHTLEAAAVLGRTFTLPLLDALTASPDSLPAQIDELERRSFLYCEHAEPAAEFSFRHVLLQMAVYQMLTDDRRNSLHLQAAHAIERLYADNLDACVDALAYHYVRTDDLPRAVAVLLQAGAAARRLFANAAAAAYFQQALDRLAQLAAQGQPPSDRTWSDAWHQLGRACYALGAFERADAAFRAAIAHAQAAGASTQAVVRLMYWLGEALYWEGMYPEFLANAKAGLALLPADAPCSETALMLGHLTAGSIEMGEWEECDRYARLLRPIVRTFPFSEELSPAYHHVSNHYKMIGDAAAALEWAESLRIEAAARQDMTSLAKAIAVRGIALLQQGDYAAAALVLQEALALSQRIGEMTMLFFCLIQLAFNAICQGEFASACEYADRLAELLAGSEGGANLVVAAHYYLCAGRVRESLDMFLAGAARAAPELQSVEMRYWFACALAAAGRRAEAVQSFQRLLASCRPDSPPLLGNMEQKPIYWGAIAALDRLLADPPAFHSLCDAERARWPEGRLSGRCSWYAVPAQRAGADPVAAGDEVDDSSLAQWQWCDAYHDSECHIRGGVELAAADGRDIFHINAGAPVLRTPVAGDFALQAQCLPSLLRPVIMGGLLLWCDMANFVRLDFGGLGAGEISCLGAVGGRRCFWGRTATGCSEPYLRLERSGETVRALYSEDGHRWLLVAEAEAAAAGQWTAGLMALGMVDRAIFPSAPGGGGAMRFRAIHLCNRLTG